MRKRLRKAVRKLRSGKLSSALRALSTPHHTETRVETARARVARHLREVHGNTVAYGPFADMQLPAEAVWGGHDVPAKILGTYEAQVAARLCELSNPEGALIDIGSADGYFAIGALWSGLFKRCICFETSRETREKLVQTAHANRVGEGIEIHGHATEATVGEVAAGVSDGVVLCDVEGAEFELLTTRCLSNLSHMPLIIELHEFLVPDGNAKRHALAERASALFDVEYLTSAFPQALDFPELEGFDDNHRLLALSEGRDRAMEWMVLTPKCSGAKSDAA